MYCLHEDSSLTLWNCGIEHKTYTLLDAATLFLSSPPPHARLLSAAVVPWLPSTQPCLYPHELLEGGGVATPDASLSDLTLALSLPSALSPGSSTPAQVPESAAATVAAVGNDGTVWAWLARSTPGAADSSGPSEPMDAFAAVLGPKAAKAAAAAAASAPKVCPMRLSITLMGQMQTFSGTVSAMAAPTVFPVMTTPVSTASGSNPGTPSHAAGSAGASPFRSPIAAGKHAGGAIKGLPPRSPRPPQSPKGSPRHRKISDDGDSTRGALGGGAFRRPWQMLPMVATGSDRGSVELVDVECPSVTSSYQLHPSTVRGVKWLGPNHVLSYSSEENKRVGPSGKQVSSFTNRLVLLDITTGHSEQMRLSQEPEPGPILALRVSPSAGYLIILLKGSPAEVWRMQPRPVLMRTINLPFTMLEFEMHNPATQAGINPDDEIGERFCFAMENGLLGVFTIKGRHIRDAKPAQPVSNNMMEGMLSAMAFQGNTVVMGDTIGNVRCWDIISGACRGFHSQYAPIRRIRIAPVAVQSPALTGSSPPQATASTPAAATTPGPAAAAASPLPAAAMAASPAPAAGAPATPGTTPETSPHRGVAVIKFSDGDFSIFDLELCVPIVGTAVGKRLKIKGIEIEWAPLPPRVAAASGPYTLGDLMLAVASTEGAVYFVNVGFLLLTKYQQSACPYADTRLLDAPLRWLHPSPLTTPSLIPAPLAIALRMLLQRGLSADWFCPRVGNSGAAQLATVGSRLRRAARRESFGLSADVGDDIFLRSLKVAALPSAGEKGSGHGPEQKKRRGGDRRGTPHRDGGIDLLTGELGDPSPGSSEGDSSDEYSESDDSDSDTSTDGGDAEGAPMAQRRFAAASHQRGVDAPVRVILRSLRRLRDGGQLLDPTSLEVYRAASEQGTPARCAFVAERFGNRDESLFWKGLLTALHAGMALQGQMPVAPAPGAGGALLEDADGFLGGGASGWGDVARGGAQAVSSLDAPGSATQCARESSGGPQGAGIFPPGTDPRGSYSGGLAGQFPLGGRPGSGTFSTDSAPGPAGSRDRAAMVEAAGGMIGNLVGQATKEMHFIQQLPPQPDITQSTVHNFVRCGRFEDAASLLLETATSTSAGYMKDALRALVLANAVSPVLYEQTVKVVAANMSADGDALASAQLLCAVGHFLDACQQLQSAGKWEDAAIIASVNLEGKERARVYSRWAQHLAHDKTTTGFWKGMLLYVTAGQAGEAMKAMREARLPDDAAILAAVCEEELASYGLGAKRDGPGGAPAPAPGTPLALLAEDIRGAMEHFFVYEEWLAKLCKEEVAMP
eukprot:jgi/Mesvir1/7360/Mv19166-RA.2